MILGKVKLNNVWSFFHQIEAVIHIILFIRHTVRVQQLKKYFFICVLTQRVQNQKYNNIKQMRLSLIRAHQWT